MKSEVVITTLKDGRTAILIDGKDLSMNMRSINFSVNRATLQPILELEYGCYEQTTIEGQMDVVHICPKKAR